MGYAVKKRKKISAREKARMNWPKKHIIHKAFLWKKMLDEGEVGSLNEIAAKEGVTRARVTQIMNHLRLCESLQERVLRGEFGYVPERLVRECIRYRSEAEQRRLLKAHARISKSTRRSGPPRLRTLLQHANGRPGDRIERGPAYHRRPRRTFGSRHQRQPGLHFSLHSTDRARA